MEKEEELFPDTGGLAFRVREIRDWVDLRQEELAKLAGITSRTVREIEQARRLPPSIEGFLRVVIALRTSVHALIEEEELDRLRADVEARRMEHFPDQCDDTQLRIPLD